jgi:4-amino-4-deoxychorismate lyase
LDVVAILGRGIVDPDEPAIHVDDLGLIRGDGCFEGLRVRRQGTGTIVDDLDSHLQRMAASAASLSIPFQTAEWMDIVELVSGEWGRGRPDQLEASLKLVLTRGREGSGVPTGFASISPIPDGVVTARRQGVTTVTLTRGFRSDAFADAPWMLGGVKTLSYAVHVAAVREAHRRGADDALFISTDGQLLESTTSSIVWFVNRDVFTVPAGDNGILSSITTDQLLDRATKVGYEAHRSTALVDDLTAADLAMLVSSVRGPVRIRSIDGKELVTSDSGHRALEISRRLLAFPGHDSAT